MFNFCQDWEYKLPMFMKTQEKVDKIKKKMNREWDSWIPITRAAMYSMTIIN